MGERLHDFDDDVLDDFVGIDAENRNLQPIVQVGATLACGGHVACGAWASASISAGFTLANGGSLWDATKAGAISYSTVYAFDWAGGVPAGSEYGVEHFARHALVGCASSAASGGSCGRGAMSAMAGLAGTDYGLVGSVVAGGTVSVIGGGKFANGAATAAFGYLYNAMRHMQQRAQALADAISQRGFFLGKGEADWLYQLNSNPDLSVTVDPMFFTVGTEGQWGGCPSGDSGACSIGYATGDDYWVHGQVTIRSRPNGTYGIYDQTYDFKMHPDFSLKGIARNISTWIGEPPGGWPNTAYTIRYRGNASVVTYRY